MVMNTEEMIRRAKSVGKPVKYASGPSARIVQCRIRKDGQPEFLVDSGSRAKVISQQAMDELLVTNLQKSLERARQYSHIKGEKIVLSDVPRPPPGQLSTEDMIQKALTDADQECCVSIPGHRHIKCKIVSSRDGMVKTPCFTIHEALDKQGKKMIRATAERELELAGDKARLTW